MLRDAVLGRIVDYDGISLLCGVHPRLLPPIYAAAVVERARKRLRRKRAVPVDRLRDATFGRHLIRYWEETVDDLDERSATPPRLHNTDGDPLVITVDHFEFAPEAMREIDARIGKLDGAQREPDDGTTAYVFVRPDDATRPDSRQTMIGRVMMSRSELRIENQLAGAGRHAARTDRGRLRRAHPAPGPRALGPRRARQGFGKPSRGARRHPRPKKSGWWPNSRRATTRTGPTSCCRR